MTNQQPGVVDPFAVETAPQVTAVRAGEDLDWVKVEAYLREQLPADIDLTGSFEVLQFPGGSANLTYRKGPAPIKSYLQISHNRALMVPILNDHVSSARPHPVSGLATPASV